MCVGDIRRTHISDTLFPLFVLIPMQSGFVVVWDGGFFVTASLLVRSPKDMSGWSSFAFSDLVFGNEIILTHYCSFQSNREGTERDHECLNIASRS